MKNCVLAIAMILCAGVTSTEASATSFVQKLIVTTAERYGVPKFLALKVAQFESSFTCDAEGKAGELGPLQIKPETARMIGYRGLISALRSCGAGLEWGMKHLALAIRSGGVWKHNQGLAAKVKSPAAAEYERKVMSQTLISNPLEGTRSVAKRLTTSPPSRPQLGLTLRQAAGRERNLGLPRGS
jgi:soluble lytic murein transglycosylase-like protein